MTLNRWDIVFVRAEEGDPVGHPAVVLSSEDILGDVRCLRFNVVTGTKRTPSRALAPGKCFTTPLAVRSGAP